MRAGKRYVSLYLVVVDTYLDALKGASDALLMRRSGKATFRRDVNLVASGRVRRETRSIFRQLVHFLEQLSVSSMADSPY